ncbi:MAG: alginate export family protein [Planctomycetota bacterium]|nr:alginate export family protein [Planctomycetota bacterium]
MFYATHTNARLALCFAAAFALSQHAAAPRARAQSPAAAASAPSQPAPPPKPPPFRLFRYDEDYSYLADPARRTSPLDSLKYIPLDDSGDITLSLGGEARSRYEYSSAPFFGLRAPGHDDFFLQRFLLHSDLRVGERDGLHGRAFVQLLSGLVAGEEFSKPGNQDNALDVQQAFGEVILGDTRPAAVATGDTSFALRAGRQEMGFGSYRLVTSREPTNARLAFDGVRATLHTQRLTFDAFLVRPTDHKIGLFNDGQDDNSTFWGLYSAIPLGPESRRGLDVYYLGLHRENTRFQSGVGEELRHSFGARLWGRARGWDHDTEAVVQFGDFDLAGSSQDILAWTVASNTGYTFENAAWKPRLGLKLNVASGDDDPGDDRLATFNPLFPRNNYFSDANLLAPFNFFDIHPTLTVRPLDSVTVTAGWDVFFRYSTDDAVFSPVGLVIPATASDGRFVGSTLSLVADWAINRNLTLSASYAHFFKGEVVRDAGGRDVDYFGVWFTAKF